MTTIPDPACTCGHPRSEHAYVVVDGPCGARSDGCQKYMRATESEHEKLAHICPECAAGKCRNCDGAAWCKLRDGLTHCDHECRAGGEQP